MISASQVREALVLLGWSIPTLAERAQITFNEGAMAQDDFSKQRLGGLQLGGIQRALEAACVEFIPENGGGAGMRLRKVESQRNIEE